MNYDALSREWLKCALCNHVHNSIRLSPENLVTLYKRFRDQEWRKESPDEYFDRITAMPAAASENSQKMSLLQRVVDPEKLSQGGRAIDFGCGGGVLLHTAKKALGAGWQFFGVEPTPSFAEL
jgi:cyclopropane fatty-acyl-phospholipid synthase-like methyltransferase